MRFFYLIGSIVWLCTGWAQAQSIRSVHYAVELGGLGASGEQTPFWLRTNQYGTVPLQGSFGTLRIGAVRAYRMRPDSSKKTKSRLDWGFGLNAVANVGPTPAAGNPAVLFPDAYVKFRLGWLELFGGNRREVYGLGDTLLTSGFVAWSGNALPLPKIQLHMPDFVPLGFTKKIVALRAGYAHGWFANTYIQGSYLHQKYFYARIGKPGWWVRFYGGINHQVQWGGRANYLIGSPFAIDGHLSTSFRDYLSLITGSYPDAIQNDRFTDFDGTNRVGNHIGSYDVALEWRGKTSNWLLYHQHIYEDASGLAWQNFPDGLTGLRYLNKSTRSRWFRVRRVVFEWLTTLNQSGPTFDPQARYQGADNYFNHSQYMLGWSYRGRTIGTPFIVPRTDLDRNVNNDYSGGGFFPNNRLTAGYVGLMGEFRRGPSLTLRASMSQNQGTYIQPYPRPFRQFSAYLMAQWPLGRGTFLTTSAAVDRGELLPGTTGGFVSFRKSW